MLIEVKQRDPQYLGKLVWITNQEKVFRSVKRFDAFERFLQHDSIKMGDVSDVFPMLAYNQEIGSILGKSRVYGIFLEESICFFATWEEVKSYADAYFEQYDLQLEKDRLEKKKQWEMARNRHLDKQKRLHEEAVQQDFKKRQAALDLHKKKYGIFSLFAPEFREANCFRCGNALYSSTHETCGSCKWMVCECGACGCQYEK
ncbi:hypothetical protein ACFOZ1_02240 [Gracilibacillus marinus]|uniref:Uncharacterized protein n=1 Tax=Gracilibacillus marinus TaxID=630535 RepID=A0ABV8VQZ4_9BACI